MHNKDKVNFDKKHPYEYNVCLYILEELCDKGVIDIFEMAEALILLRKKYKTPVIDIYGKKSIPIGECLPNYSNQEKTLLNTCQALFCTSVQRRIHICKKCINFSLMCCKICTFI